MVLFGLNSTIFWSFLGLAIAGLVFGFVFIIGNAKRYQLSFARGWYMLYLLAQLPVFLYFIIHGQNYSNLLWIVVPIIEALILVIPFFIIKRTLLNKRFRSELLSRNYGLISKDIQKKIKNSCILLIGCGLGSQIGVLAARSGFEKFILCDGDKVELNNLNRQAFELSDIGKNKAKVLKRKILSINPKCRVDIFPHFVKDKEEARNLIKKADIIVNMADPEEIMYEINSESQKQGKMVLSPLNLGFDGYLIAFGPKTITMEKMIGGKISSNDFYMRLINASLGSIPKYLLAMYQKFGEKLISGEMPAPQLATASYQTSAGIVNSIIKILSKEPILTAPKAVIIGQREGQ